MAAAAIDKYTLPSVRFKSSAFLQISCNEDTETQTQTQTQTMLDSGRWPFYRFPATKSWKRREEEEEKWEREGERKAGRGREARGERREESRK